MFERFRGRAWRPVVSFAALIGLSAGCNDSSRGPSAPLPSLPTECGVTHRFDPEDFPAEPRIDNRWFPLVPGRQYSLDGTANRGGGLLHHRVLFTVTDVTKVINGVNCIVMWDRDYNGDELVEVELAFFAQDRWGNVWSLGEYPEEYERGEFLGAPNTWIAGLGGAYAGIHMVRDPEIDTRFLQGWAPEVNFLDCAVVFATGQRTCVPYSCFENVLVTDESSPLEPGSGHQRKYYAPGYGIVRVGAVEDPENEQLVLLDFVELGAAALAEVREETLKLDRRGYVNSDIYRKTAPAR